MKNTKTLNLRKMVNDDCIGNCDKIERKQNTEDDLCNQTVSIRDNLKVRCVGDWAFRKIFRLVQYFGIFSQGMKNEWSGNLNYIELCSGPGRCIYRSSKEEVDGTALAILNHENFHLLRTATFIDFNPEVVKILKQRIQALGKEDKAYAVVGDYTNFSQMKQIFSKIPQHCLNLVLIDPTDCGIPFCTIKEIKDTLRRADLIINVALYSDAGRNLRKAILNPESHEKSLKKYGAFLGDNTFLFSSEMLEIAKIGKDEELRQKFITKYMEKLSEIGYEFFDNSVNVSDKGRNLYTLLFASGNNQGLNFWKKTLKSNEYGQIALDLF